MVYDAQDKKTLVMSVRAAVEKLVSQFSHTQTSATKPKMSECKWKCIQLTLINCQTARSSILPLEKLHYFAKFVECSTVLSCLRLE